MGNPFLQAKGLKKHFPVTKGLFFRKELGQVKAVDGVDFTLNEGETFGMVGESGCGKTTVAKLILLLERPSGGSLVWNGKDANCLSASDLGEYRSSIQAVFQDPYSSLNPRMRVRDIVAEPIQANKTCPDKQTCAERVIEVLEQVGLGAGAAPLFPHEFSGGQRQRIAIARALAPKPKCIILDEPVSALDVSIRAQILNLIKDLQEKSELCYFFIAHDLAAVKHMSRTLAVMYLGKIVELGNGEAVYGEPLHPYTKGLLLAALPARPGVMRKEVILTGEVPSPLNPPAGCRFHTRCRYAKPICLEEEPVLKTLGSHHSVACHLH
jgi:oligopeptide/dipeptide ABC transporter ATP-binding protein